MAETVAATMVVPVAAIVMHFNVFLYDVMN